LVAFDREHVLRFTTYGITYRNVFRSCPHQDEMEWIGEGTVEAVYEPAITQFPAPSDIRGEEGRAAYCLCADELAQVCRGLVL
jgi:hypothetical protein